MHRLFLQATYIYMDHQTSATSETCKKNYFLIFFWFVFRLTHEPGCLLKFPV